MMWSDLKDFESSLKLMVDFVKSGSKDLYSFSKRKWTEIKESPRFQSMVLSSIWFYHSTETYCYFLGKSLYDENRLIREPVDFIYFILNGRAISKNETSEFVCENWFQLTKLCENEKEFSLTTKRTAMDVNDIDAPMKINEFIDEFGEILDSDSFFIMKHDERFITRLIRTAVAPIDSNTSDVRFIHIEYTHPEMKDSVELKLASGFYLSGNELFSPAFILSLLEKQNQVYHFDMNYELKLLDSNMKDINIKSNQYVKIDSETEYVVKEI